MGPSATVSVTVKVATPPVLLTAVITELPVAALKLTVLPGTVLPAPSFSVTVMVDLLIPLAGTDVGLALTVDSVGLMAVTIRLAVDVEPAVLVAVLLYVPAVAEVTDTLTMQVLLAAITAPDIPNVLPPLVPLKTPAPQPAADGFAALTRPAG